MSNTITRFADRRAPCVDVRAEAASVTRLQQLEAIRATTILVVAARMHAVLATHGPVSRRRLGGHVRT